VKETGGFMKSQKDKDFVEYVMSFYGAGGLYQEFFGTGVSESEVKKALRIRKKNKKFTFDGDSMDREIVRDIMLYQRGDRNLECNMKPYFGA
jgi:hypothetical protein